jgi:hypothetical protein
LRNIGGCSRTRPAATSCCAPARSVRDVDKTEGINTEAMRINTGAEEGINTGPPSPPGINTGDD